MNRQDAKKVVKSRYAEYLKPAAKKVNGKTTYICPIPGCGNGTGKDGDGMVIDPRGDGTQLKCFKCGFYGDIIDLYQQEHNCDVGEAFTALYKYFGITIDDEQQARASAEPRKEPQRVNTQDHAENATESATEGAERKPDFTSYYKECKEHIQDQAAQAYLAFRGISNETAARYWIGYEPAKKLLIIPATKSFYVGRDTTGHAERRYNNPTGTPVELFNKAALYNDAARPVFVTEGAINALSIIEAGGEAIATNSAANWRKVIDAIKETPTRSTLILCYDNDDAGKNGTTQLADALKELNIPYVNANICGEHNDANDALIADRAKFIKAVRSAENNILCPGLLTLERAEKILDAVDDHFLDMPHFPQLSAMLKLKTHDTVVIAADTGAGKSSLALNIMHDLQDRYPAIYINLEMDEATILQRLVAIHTGVELDEIEGYKHDQNTRARVNAAITEITAHKPIQLIADIYDLAEIEKRIQAATKDRTEPTIVFIDTALLLNVGNRSASRYERFTQISEELRRISRLNNIILFELLQQNREGKKEDQKTPANSSLKESGSWENDATKIMFLWHNPKLKCKELVITKNRSGKTGNIALNYSPHTQEYSEAKGEYITLSDDIATPWDNVPRK